MLVLLLSYTTKMMSLPVVGTWLLSNTLLLLRYGTTVKIAGLETDKRLLFIMRFHCLICVLHLCLAAQTEQ